MSIKPTRGNVEDGVAAGATFDARVTRRAAWSAGAAATVTITPIEPSPIPEKRADQLRLLLKELPPKLRARWGAVLKAEIASLQNRGPKASEVEACKRYLQERIDQGRQLDSALVTETAKEMLCSRRTAERASKTLRNAT